ncbi:MAG: hypothetical protein ACI8UO_002842 [Verrucomicrobiales bacterium]|jgi:hypothetical protein
MTDSNDAQSPDAPKKEEEKDRKGLLLLLLLFLLVCTIVAIFVVRAMKDSDETGDGGTADGGETPEAPQPPAEPVDELTKLTLGDIDDDQSIVDFICRFVESGEDNGPEAELSFYADAVDSYFGKPNFDKAKILEERKNYLKKWPERSYRCIGGSNVVSRADGVVLANAKFKYTVKNGEKEASGTGQAFYKIRKRGDRLEIFWIGEKLDN